MALSKSDVSKIFRCNSKQCTLLKEQSDLHCLDAIANVYTPKGAV